MAVRRRRSSRLSRRSRTPRPPPSAPRPPIAELKALLSETLRQLDAGPRGALDRNEVPAGSIVISGTGLGLPGADKPVMDPENAARILGGEQFVALLPERFRERHAATGRSRAS